jgi:hypothetical protein
MKDARRPTRMHQDLLLRGITKKVLYLSFNAVAKFEYLNVHLKNTFHYKWDGNIKALREPGSNDSSTGYHKEDSMHSPSSCANRQSHSSSPPKLPSIAFQRVL